jgi:hypothetical protein
MFGISSSDSGVADNRISASDRARVAGKKGFVGADINFAQDEGVPWLGIISIVGVVSLLGLGLVLWLRK